MTLRPSLLTYSGRKNAPVFHVKDAETPEAQWPQERPLRNRGGNKAEQEIRVLLLLTKKTCISKIPSRISFIVLQDYLEYTKFLGCRNKDQGKMLYVPCDSGTHYTKDKASVML